MSTQLLWQIFLLFTRVALFSWGGGPASLALMQREVTNVGWSTPNEFADAVAFGIVIKMDSAVDRFPGGCVDT